MTAFALEPTAPTTELEAVNRIISIIGELPVDDLDEATAMNSDVALALMFIRANTRDVQVRGWTFNTDEGVELQPDEAGHIVLPQGVLRATLSDTRGYNAERITVRGQKLYDLKNRTAIFDRPITVDTITILPFTDLPEPVRMFVVIKAGRTFQGRFVGSDVLHAFSEDDEKRAENLLSDFECDPGNHNFLTGSEDVYMGWADR